MSKVSVNLGQLTSEINQVKSSSGNIKSLKKVSTSRLEITAARRFIDKFNDVSNSFKQYGKMVDHDSSRLQTLGKNQETLDKKASR